MERKARLFGEQGGREGFRLRRDSAQCQCFGIRAKALLTVMHATTTLDDLRIRGEPPSIRLHKLRGDRRGSWSVAIRLPWCITFKFKDGEFSEAMIE